MGELQIKRAYDDFTAEDGKRVLVDRLWPRGIKKETLALDLWEKSIAPTNELRKEFNHIPEKYPWFKDHYRQEIEANAIYPTFLAQIKGWLQTENVTLIYGAKDEIHNQAVVLQERLLEDLKK